ncbi:MAG: glycosyltransferase [Anaerolineae bacterium]|nr:glycosyltransferase [Anaerolineae bacterium]
MGQRQDVASLLKASALGVLSSTTEGLPMALLEYGLMGLPVVATRVGQVPEVLKQGNWAWLVEPGNPAALRQAILEALCNPEQRAIRARAFQAHIEAHYSAPAVLQQITTAYADLLSH